MRQLFVKKIKKSPTLCIIKKYEKKFSIVIPVYNEEKNVGVLCRELLDNIAKLNTFDFEIILVNDGSRDSSWQRINELAQQHACIKGISLSRNFGHQIALSAGYDYATGDAIITMDADMQHPPHMIPIMIEKWLEGFSIVYVKSVIRNDFFLKKITALVYYRILHSLADVTIPRNIADFRLIDKKVANVLRQSKEKMRYLRGMVAWTGFKHTIVMCQFSERLTGVSGYTWKKMFKLAFDGITSFSHFPLHIALYIGCVIVGSGMIMFGYISYQTCIEGRNYPLFKWLLAIIYMGMGMQLFLYCLLGEYIGRIYNQLKGRPLYIVAQQYNIESP